MGSYPQRDANGRLSTQLVLRSPDLAALEAAHGSLNAKLAGARLLFKAV